MAIICCLCAKQLEAGDRRTLNPRAEDNNRRIVEFLAEYVFERDLTDFGLKWFCVGPVFLRQPKGERALQSTRY